MRVRLLGSPAITFGETVHELPPGRAAALLYSLAYRAAWVTRDELLYLFWPDFWPDATEERARASLRSLLSALRRSAFAPKLEVERTRVRWLVTTDLDEPVSRSAGVLLDGFRISGAEEFDHWLDLERSALADRRRATLFREVADAVAADRHGDAIAALERGDVRAAMRHVTALAGNLTGRPASRTAHAERLQLGLFDAEVSLAGGAARETAAAIVGGAAALG